MADAARTELLTTTTSRGVAIFQDGVGYVVPGADYWTVELGPKPDLPEWHEQSKPTEYPFPSVTGATTFAKTNKADCPNRGVVIRFPDGRRWNGKDWV